jgi:hypothetical protein
MDSDNKSTPPARKKREESPRSGLYESIPYRISGLEKTKTEPGMTPADIAALDRVIVKLKAELAAKNEPKENTQ